jgi:hypothetical protein
MVNNSININITNHHVSPKESLNSDGVMVRYPDIGGLVDHHCLSFP